MRQIVLDTETTGLEVADGHRIIEIGAIEVVNRRVTERVFHQYLNPDREIDAGAQEVHGISLEFLQDKPRFADVCTEFMEFVRDGELVIHNAAFDMGFLNAELKREGADPLESVCTVFDTLTHARKLHPGQRNNLDALCKRYEIDNSHRELHGALLDAQILADVYLAMTGGQVTLGLGADQKANQKQQEAAQFSQHNYQLKVLAASEDELSEHERMLAHMGKSAEVSSAWNE